MLDDFKAALARVQSDYDFYVRCQTEPDAALEEYDLTAEELAALTDPDQLAGVLKKGLLPRNLPSITIKISGTHDWVNRSKKPPQRTNLAQIRREVQAIERAGTKDERTEAAVRLMELIG